MSAATANARVNTGTGTPRRVRVVADNPVHGQAHSAAQRRSRARRRSGVFPSILVFALFAAMGLLFMIVPDKPETVMALGAGLTVVLAIMRFPVIGTYTCVLLGLLFDGLPSPWVHTFASDLGVFRNLSTRGLPDAVLVSMFEVVVLLTMISVFARRFHAHQKVTRGVLFLPVMLYGAMVLFGEVNGVLSGGDFKISLWEVRPLMYIVAIYILAVNTITEPRHVRALLWLVVLATGLRSIDAVSRLFLMTPDVRAVASVILEHDDSLILAAVLALAVPAIVWRSRLQKRLVWLLVAMVPLLLYVIAINHRRAAYFCVIMTLVTMVPYFWAIIDKRTRIRLAQALVIVAVLGGAYVAVFWNSNSAIAEPAQAIRSVFEPNERDYLSNLYRIQEDTNLRFTIGRSPIVGVGFGKPMDVIVPMVDLSDMWALQLYMPHNNMLWLWMRMGVLGFATFWMLAGATIFLIAGSVRAGVARMRALESQYAETLPSAPSAPTSPARAMRGEGSGLRVVHLRRREGFSVAHVGAGKEAARQRMEIRECAEFLLMAFLVHGVLVSMLMLAVVDQGLMSPRLATFWGATLGTLAAAWATYAVKFRAPVAEAAVPEPVFVPDSDYEEIESGKRNRVRVIAGPQGV